MATRKLTLREQIERNADRARGYAQDRDTLWRTLHAVLPLLSPTRGPTQGADAHAAHAALYGMALDALRKTARCTCGNPVGYDPIRPPPTGTTCERCLST